MTKLIEVLEEKAGAQQVAKVEQLVDFATNILDLVRDTFPTYTLHNHVHAENVINLMELLLGDRVENLSALEAEMLILSAYFHDIGMVFDPDEKAGILDSYEFNEYLKRNPNAYLSFIHDHDEESIDSVMEGFCREVHADRVTVWLQRVPDELLTWGSVPITQALTMVCKSHNQPGEELKSGAFDDKFLGTCDLRFCALILRLADILDFDNTRSPNPVYSYLNLGDRTTPRKHLSDVEWRKHLASDGFIFPAKRRSDYELTINAGPDHPAVESDIREFLTTIEKELSECAALLRFCTDEWVDLPLPGKISRKGIISKGYTFGDFRFKLDRTAILDLFMGENLYSEPTVFFRELLQNSIDAVRARCDLEGVSLADSHYSIRITDWFDAEGFQWVKIDDDGIGMDLDVVENYLLTIGSSYYSSSDFLAQLARRAGSGKSSHVPISRFGVGLLSSFMVSNQIELSTRKVVLEGYAQAPLRISFNHLADYFVVQSPDNKATPLPDRSGGSEPGYRDGNRPGTSIVVKIDPARYSKDIDVMELTRRYTLASRVPLYVNGIRYRDDLGMANRPVTPHSKKLEWKFAERELLDPALADAILDTELQILPIEFHLEETGTKIAGKGHALLLDLAKVHKALMELPIERALMVDPKFLNDIRPAIKELIGKSIPSASINVGYSTPDIRVDPYGRLKQYELEDLFREHPPSVSEAELLTKFSSSATNWTVTANLSDVVVDFGWTEDDSSGLMSWSHGGVRLPSLEDRRSMIADLDTGYSENLDVAGNLVVVGSIWLDDEFRPELNIARDKVLRLPYSLLSAVRLMLRRSIKGQVPAGWSQSFDRMSFTAFVDSVKPEASSVTCGDVLDDPLSFSSLGWTKEQVYRESETGRLLSIDDLRGELSSGRQIMLDSFGDIDYCLLDINFVTLFGDEGITVIRERDALSKFDERLRPYPPGVFVPYASEEYLFHLTHVLPRSTDSGDYYFYGPANRTHKLARWFLTIAPALSQKAPGLVTEFVTAMDAKSYRWERRSPNVLMETIQRVVGKINRIMLASNCAFDQVIDYTCFHIVESPARDEGIETKNAAE